jgi:hypothetical protein
VPQTKKPSVLCAWSPGSTLAAHPRLEKRPTGAPVQGT